MIASTSGVKVGRAVGSVTGASGKRVLFASRNKIVTVSTSNGLGDLSFLAGAPIGSVTRSCSNSV